MRIAAIDVFQVDLPYAGGTYRLSGGGGAVCDLARVRRPGAPVATYGD